MTPSLQAFPLVLTYGGIVKNRKILSEPISLQNSQKAKVYHPRSTSRTQLPGIYLQHGMNVLGIDDNRMSMLAESLAYCGFSVVTPELEEVKGLIFTKNTIDNIEKLGVELSANHSWYDGKRFGYFSVSFSSGMGLIAFSRPKTNETVKSIMAVGSYCDFNDTYPFVFQNFERDNYGVLVLLFNYYSRLEPDLGEELRPVFFEAAIDNSMIRKGEDALAPKLLRNCSPKAQSVFQRLMSSPEYRLEISLAMKACYPQSIMDELSPATQISGLKAPVSLLHGETDPVISPQETQKLVSILKSHGKPFVVRTSTALTHGDQLPLHKQVGGVPPLLKTFGSFFHWLRKKE